MEDRTFYIRHPEHGIFFSDACNRRHVHCLMGKALAIAMCEEMQLYPKTRGAKVHVFQPEDVGEFEFKPFILG